MVRNVQSRPSYLSAGREEEWWAYLEELIAHQRKYEPRPMLEDNRLLYGDSGEDMDTLSLFARDLERSALARDALAHRLEAEVTQKIAVARACLTVLCNASWAMR